ncbi:MAG: porin family protein [Bacteroidota bacterium]
MSDRLENMEFDKLIRDRYKGHGTTPPDALWEKVNERVQTIDAVNYRKRFGFARWLSIGLVALLVGTVAFYEWRLNDSEKVVQTTDAIPDAAVSDNKGAVQGSDMVRKPVTSGGSNTIAETSIGAAQNNMEKADGELTYSPTTTVHSTNTVESNRADESEGHVNMHETETAKIDNTGTEHIVTEREEVGDETLTEDENTAMVSNEVIQVAAATVDIEHYEAVNTLLSTDDEDAPADLNSTIADIPEAMAAAESDTAETNANLPNVEQEEATKAVSRFSLTAFFSPDFTYRQLTNNTAALNPDVSASYFNQNEKGGVAYTSGLMAGFDINDRWMVKGGVFYSTYRQHYNPVNALVQVDTIERIYTLSTSMGSTEFNGNDLEEQNGNNEDEFETSFNSKQRLSFINVPLMVEYRIGNGKTRYFITAGFSANFVMSEDMEVEMEDFDGENNDVEAGDFEGLQDMNFSAMVGVGAEFGLFKSFSLLLNPGLRTSITPINKSLPVKSYPYSIGLATGIRYRFQ